MRCFEEAVCGDLLSETFKRQNRGRTASLPLDLLQPPCDRLHVLLEVGVFFDNCTCSFLFVLCRFFCDLWCCYRCLTLSGGGRVGGGGVEAEELFDLLEEEESFLVFFGVETFDVFLTAGFGGDDDVDAGAFQ